MISIFKPNVILHIEDEKIWSDIVYDDLSKSDTILALFDNVIVRAESFLKEEVSDTELQKEMKSPT